MSENHVDLVINGDIAMEEMPAHVEYVQGMENPTEGYSNIVRWLVKHGYSDEEIGKVNFGTSY